MRATNDLQLAARRSAALILSTSLLAGHAPAAPAEIASTWVAGSDVWNIPTNWAPNGVPNNGGGDTYAVVITSAGSVVVGLNMNAAINTLTVGANDALDILNSRILTIAGGQITNSGTIFLSSVGNSTSLRAGSNVTLTGGGTVSISGNLQNRLDAQTVGNRLTNLNNLIEGSGQIGLNALNVTNQGTIEANDPATNLLLDPPSSGDFTNQSVFRARNGATLELRPGAYPNVGGVIEAIEGAQVSLVTALITGGELTTDGTGLIVCTANSTRLIDVLNSGALRINNGVTTFIQGSMINSDTIALVSIGNSTSLRIDGDLALSGGGTITMSSNLQNRIDAQTTGNRLTNVDHLIVGSGQIGLNSLALTNQATILANDPLTNLLLDPPSAGFVNESVFRASDGATMELRTGNYLNTSGLIEALDGSQVLLVTATITGGQLNTAGSGAMICTSNSTRFIDVTTSSDLRLNNGVTTFIESSITNTGTIALGSIGNSTSLRIDGDIALIGGGIITMTGNLQNRIDAQTTGDRLTNVDHLIVGSGQIGLNSLALTNQATIHANDPAANLLFDAPSAGFVNEGVFRASDGATLVLNPGTYDNSSGLIEILDGSQLTLNTPVIIGGDLTTAGTGVVICTGSSTRFVDVTSSSDLRINNGIITFLESSMTNTGTIALESVGNSTSLRMDGDLALSGGGTVTLTENLQNRIDAQTTGDRLTNVDNLIVGSAQIGLNALSVTNQGTIEANGATIGMIIDPPSNGDFTNEGTLRATGDAGLQISAGPMMNAGTVEITANSKLDRTAGDYVQTTGTTTVNGELEVDSGVVDLQGGVLNGTGLIDGNVEVNGGAFAPGSSAGLIMVEGDYVQNAGGTLEIEVGGLVPGDDHDQLAVSATAELAGSLHVTLLDKYEPLLGDSFVIVTAAEITGVFECVDLGELTAGYFHVIYSDTAVTLTVQGTPPPLADLDGNGIVGFSDLLVLLSAWGPCTTTCCPADLNFDGIVGFADLLMVLSDWD